MNVFLVQILAMGMTVSQLFSKPVEQFKVRLDPQVDQAQASQFLKDGCTLLTNQVQDSRFNAEVLLSALQADAEANRKKDEKNQPAKSGPAQLLKRVDFGGLLNAYRLFCKNDNSVADKINLTEVITYYNQVFKDLKDVNALRNYRMGEATMVVDRQGKAFNEMYGAGNRRLVVPINKIPEHVKQAFVSAEDQNFYRHKGADLSGLIRAFSSMAGGASGRPQGGSTITQQVVKNLLINDDLTVERKMRELVLAMRLEKVLSKDQILEIYLNHIFLGRSSWGVEMAARSYFGPQVGVANLSPEQAALLAALTKGPSAYSPDRFPEQAKSRRQYVLERMREDCEARKAPNCPSVQQVSEWSNKPLQTVAFESPSARGGFYFLDAILKEAKSMAGLDFKNLSTHSIQATVHPALQKATEEAVRDGLMNYEQNTGRKVWTGPQGSIANDIEKYKMKWEEILPRVQPRLYDIPWTVATVLDASRGMVGLPSGQSVPLKGPPNVLRRLKNYDLIFVDVAGKEKKATATLKIPARVQGSALVMENKTGRILAISGGFSYAATEYNRALLALRQPGSTIKPFVYLAALNEGFQPNTLVPDLAPNPPLARNWRPRNYDRQTRGLVTYRTAIENSLNLPTVQTAARLGDPDPYEGLSLVQAAFRGVGLYKPEMQKREFSEILGSRETRLIDLAVAYATVANSGLKPTPYFVDSISREGRVIYANKRPQPEPVKTIDRVAFYQLKKILEGTLSRGTAVRLKKYEGLVAGKTGTSNDESDAWFICFTNDLTIAVWVGYDDRKFGNLGRGSTGGRVALPIAEKILESAIGFLGQPQRLLGPPDEIKNQITEKNIDLKTGNIDEGQFKEVFRIDEDRTVHYTQALMLRPSETKLAVVENPPNEDEDDEPSVNRQEERVSNVPVPTSAPRAMAPGTPVPEPQLQLQVETIHPNVNRFGQDGSPYRPGVDDNYQIWRNQPRQVDPQLQQQLDRYSPPPNRGGNQ